MSKVVWNMRQKGVLQIRWDVHGSIERLEDLTQGWKNSRVPCTLEEVVISLRENWQNVQVNYRDSIIRRLQKKGAVKP